MELHNKSKSRTYERQAGARTNEQFSATLGMKLKVDALLTRLFYIFRTSAFTFL